MSVARAWIRELSSWLSALALASCTPLEGAEPATQTEGPVGGAAAHGGTAGGEALPPAAGAASPAAGEGAGTAGQSSAAGGGADPDRSSAAGSGSDPAPAGAAGAGAGGSSAGAADGGGAAGTTPTQSGAGRGGAGTGAVAGSAGTTGVPIPDGGTADGSAADAGVMPAAEPKLGGACSIVNSQACDGPASRQALRCDGTRWIAHAVCAATERCARNSGMCLRAVAGCNTEGESVCLPNSQIGVAGSGESAAVCGADLVGIAKATPCTGATPYCEAGACVASQCKTAPAGSLLANPDFATNTAGWKLHEGASATWSDRDGTQCSRSGAAAVTTPAGTLNGLYQCLTNVPASGMLRIEARVFTERAAGEPEVSWQQWQGSNCDGTPNGGAGTRVYSSGAVYNQWTNIWGSSMINPGTNSIMITLVATETSTLFDQVYVFPN